MSQMDRTMQFNFPEDDQRANTRETLITVYQALEEKGYQPINQIVGYLLSESSPKPISVTGDLSPKSP